MSPVQRRKNLHLKREKKERKVRIIPLLLVFFALSLIIFLAFIFLFKGAWDGKSKLVLVTPTTRGEILVSSFDPEGGKITTLKIPGNTQLAVSRELGSWKAKSLWQLGLNEGLDGKLLSESMAINFHLPVTFWGEEKMNGFANGGFLPIVKAILFLKKTNLGLREKLKLALFSLSVGAGGRETIDLEKTNCLKKVHLTDGEEGFIPSGLTGGKILLAFSDTALSQRNLKVSIKDATGRYQEAEIVGGVVEVIGAKVASITRSEEEKIDCEVSGKDELLITKIVSIFSCKKVKMQEDNFDVVIKLGSEFAKRF